MRHHTITAYLIKIRSYNKRFYDPRNVEINDIRECFLFTYLLLSRNLVVSRVTNARFLLYTYVLIVSVDENGSDTWFFYQEMSSF